MSLFGDLANDVVGAIGGGESHGNMVQAVMGMLNSPGSGGVAGLAKSFEQQGLGNLVSSWIGNGPNAPATAEHMQQAFGSAKIAELAQQLGISPQAAASTLATVLPTLVDRLTPNGQLPTQGGSGLLDGGLDLLKKTGLFGGGS